VADAVTGVSAGVGRRALLSLSALLCTLVLALGLAGIGAALVARADPAPDIPGCEAQKQAFDAVEADIARHNAQPHDFLLPQQQAAYDAYNAEKAQLDARQAQARAAGMSCEAAVRELAVGGSPLKPTQREVATIDAAKSRVSPGYTAPAPPGTGSNKNIVLPKELRPLAEAVRGSRGAMSQKLGNATLQGKRKSQFAIGDPDPFRPGRTIQPSPSDPTRPNLAVDHIVPVAKVVQLPGFLKLPAEQMYVVANSPLNLQWMSRDANLAKGSRDVAAMTDVDPHWQKEQAALQQQTEQKLQEIINRLLAILPPGR
jgi:hypothetical protein